LISRLPFAQGLRGDQTRPARALSQYASKVRLARRFPVLAAAAVATFAAGAGAASVTTPPRITVHTANQLAIGKSVHVSFRARALPAGGYYYGVIVLKPYRHYTRSSPPPCSTSSNMLRADYGYPRAGGEVSLALTPAKAATGHWCRGGTYSGAIYAVPHRPPCEGRYPCRSEPYEPPSPCWRAGGHIVCGVVALPRRYGYPDGLPSPLAKGTSIVARFTVRFPR
jgi:hypothetical protein